jgi:uncharacterized protein (DUF58 family)
MVSSLLAFMSVSGIAGWLNLKGLSAVIDLPDEIYSGSEYVATVTVTNRKRLLPSFLLRVEALGIRTPLHLLDSRGSERLPVVVTAGKRGRCVVGGVEFGSPFPVNFFVRSRTIAFEGEFTVFPAPARSVRFSGDGIARGAAQGGEGKGYEGEIRSISAYTGKEPRKMIHWRLSARHREFLVKELSVASAPPVIIDPDELPGATLEERLSAATFLVNRLIRSRNVPVGLRLGQASFPAATGRRHRLLLLSELALYGAG